MWEEPQFVSSTVADSGVSMSLFACDFPRVVQFAACIYLLCYSFVLCFASENFSE